MMENPIYISIVIGSLSLFVILRVRYYILFERGGEKLRISTGKNKVTIDFEMEEYHSLANIMRKIEYPMYRDTFTEKERALSKKWFKSPVYKENGT